MIRQVSSNVIKWIFVRIGLRIRPMATNKPDSEMDHEYDQIVFPKTDTQECKLEAQLSTEFAISTPQGAGLYP